MFNLAIKSYVEMGVHVCVFQWFPLALGSLTVPMCLSEICSDICGERVSGDDPAELSFPASGFWGILGFRVFCFSPVVSDSFWA